MTTRQCTFAIAITLLLASVARAAPSIAPVSVQPGAVRVGVSTEILVTALITDPTLIPTSVNLHRISPDGSVTVLPGTLKDDGANGDTLAGDRLYSLRLVVQEPNPTTMLLRVSAAFRGALRRVFSPSFAMMVVDADAVDVIGPAGGILRIDDVSSPLRGATLEIPEGAVGQPTLISMSLAHLADPLPDGHEAVSPAVKLEPSGLQLALPATLLLPLASATEDGPIVGLTRESSSSPWSRLRFSSVADDFATVTLRHFSEQVLARRSLTQTLPATAGRALLVGPDAFVTGWPGADLMGFVENTLVPNDVAILAANAGAILEDGSLEVLGGELGFRQWRASLAHLFAEHLKRREGRDGMVFAWLNCNPCSADLLRDQGRRAAIAESTRSLLFELVRLDSYLEHHKDRIGILFDIEPVMDSSWFPPGDVVQAYADLLQLTRDEWTFSFPSAKVAVFPMKVRSRWPNEWLNGYHWGDSALRLIGERVDLLFYGAYDYAGSYGTRRDGFASRVASDLNVLSDLGLAGKAVVLVHTGKPTDFHLASEGVAEAIAAIGRSTAAHTLAGAGFYEYSRAGDTEGINPTPDEWALLHSVFDDGPPAAQSLTEGFDRPDGAVGNGWSVWGAGAELSDQTLKTIGTYRYGGGIAREFPITLPARVSFDFWTDDPAYGGWFLAINAVSTLIPGGPISQVSFQQYGGSRNIYRVRTDGSGSQFEFSPNLAEPIAGWGEYSASPSHVKIEVGADLSATITITYAEGVQVTTAFGPTASGPVGTMLVLGNSSMDPGPHYFDNLKVTPVLAVVP